MVGGGERTGVAYSYSEQSRARRRRRRLRIFGRVFYVIAAATVVIGTAVVIRDGSTPSRAASPASETSPTAVATTATAVTLPVIPSSVPEGNTAPAITVPAVVTVSRSGATPVNGLTVADAEAREGDVFGVLLFSDQGSLTVGTTTGLQLYAPNGGRWLPFVGSISAVRAALATLRFTPDAGTRSPSLTILANDLGHQRRFAPLGNRRSIVIRFASSSA